MDKIEEKGGYFTILDIISWKDIVEFQVSDLPEGQEDDALANSIGKAHGFLFKDQDKKPAWKITVLEHQPKASDPTARVDIMYINHHGIGDGTSNAAFHKAFIGFLQQAISEPGSSDEVSWPFKVPNLPALSLLEEAYPIPTPLTSIPPPTDVQAIKSELNVWASHPPSFSFDTYRSLVKAITIPPSTVTNILSECRRLKTTFTGFLHSLLVLHLSKLVPDARGFRAVTPYSMRRFTGASDDEILNHVSYISTEWHEDLISLARSAAENSAEEEQVIAKITQQYQAEITEELAAVPIRGPNMLIDLMQITDLDEFCLNKMKHDRTHTYEISNVGAVKIPESKGGVELEKLTFTQSGMVDGPALGTSVISIRGKSMVVSMHWQQGILEESFMDETKAYLERRLLSFAENV